jgi:hypothetical protein
MNPSGMDPFATLENFSWSLCDAKQKVASRRGEHHFRLCNSSSNIICSVVALSCVACATRTNQEVFVQTFLHQGNNDVMYLGKILSCSALTTSYKFFINLHDSFVVVLAG